MNFIREIIKNILKEAGVTGEIELSIPPNPEMGDFAFGCFALAKEQGKSPVEVAKELSRGLDISNEDLVERVDSAGPFVNFFISASELAKEVLEKIDNNFGSLNLGKNKKYLVEYACPNPMKAFHLGHLRNLITGESVARILTNAGYNVLRVNYQGDVGMHIARALWGVRAHKSEFDSLVNKSLVEKVKFLGQAYAFGSQAYENNEEAKKEILEINKLVYSKDESLEHDYKNARAWSLEYFDFIYQKLGTHFDEFYFESEVWQRGLKIVNESLDKNIFKKSEGAVIFPGSEYGLHDRVFITSEGNPTYEAKDLALSERRFEKHCPDKVIHVVGKEQSEYFKVLFKALEVIFPQTKGREFHLPGGFLQLKEGKMSSRTGDVVLGEDLLNQANEEVLQIMKGREVVDADKISEKVSIAAVKYSILKNNVSSDIAFDIKTSVSVEGDSGPYLLYIVARINSLLEKEAPGAALATNSVTGTEKALMLALADFENIVEVAATDLDPSKIAHYLFGLAQTFNSFYRESPILKEEDQALSAFRLELVKKVKIVMVKGLHILGIETVEHM